MNMLIGLEIHVELATKTKLFCGCARSGSDEPNSRTCEVCLGHPGSKPVLNKLAVEYAIKLALATKGHISKELIFSRKSYFYPDMSKNYQITQYEIPLSTKGEIKLSSGKKIRLIRIHMEEDPAALLHLGDMQKSPYVLVDYNRSGDPLVEIVTEPDMGSPKEARDFMNQLITILQYLEIFDVNNCIIKADVNVNVKGYPRVEIKNVTGFKEIERAINYEVQRQLKELEEKKQGRQHTRAWDSEKGITFQLREKETEAEYGYIIDTDLVRTELSKKWINKIKADMPELAEEKLSKFLKEHGLKQDMALVLSKDKKLALMFEKVAKEINPELAAKWIRRELSRVLNYNKKTLDQVNITEKHLIDLLKLVEKKDITDNTAQKLLEKLVVKPFDVNRYVKQENLIAVSDKNELEKYCKEAVSENPNAIDDFKAGNEKALHFIVGQVMKKTKGKATPKEVNEIIRRLIS